MVRVASLLIVVAHLGVASTPCAEAMRGAGVPMRDANLAQHEHAAALPSNHAVHHVGHPNPAEHAHHHHEIRPAADRAEVEPKVAVVLHELRAPCPCGCGEHTSSPGTTTSPRLGFALFPPEPVRLLETPPSVYAPAAYWMPTPRPDSFAHIPIFS
jgi:hypothetical protein